MSGHVAVVTDSAASLPPALAQRFGVTTVPLYVSVGDSQYRDGVDMSPAQVAAALHGRSPVTTSRPAPADLVAAYRGCADDGATGILSVHLSGALSGTCDAARLAARESPVPVHVVDSQSLGMGLGFAVTAAARSLAEGAHVAGAAEVAARTSAACTVYFSMQTLEHLRRGGRIGAAQAWLSSALAVKPLLHIVSGRVEPFEKVRTSSRALARIEELAVQHAASGPVAIAVHHLAADERARELAERVAARTPALEEMHVVEVAGAVGAHVGPGLLGVVVSPR